MKNRRKGQRQVHVMGFCYYYVYGRTLKVNAGKYTLKISGESGKFEFFEFPAFPTDFLCTLDYLFNDQIYYETIGILF